MDEQKAAIIEVDGLVQSLGRQQILKNVSFEVWPGECFGIFGLRGTGKTSLLHILAGVDRFTAGTVKVMGCELKKNYQFKKRMGLVTQVKSLFQDLKAGENLDFIANLKNADPANVKGIITRLNLEEYLSYSVNQLEPGVYQRLALGCALLGSPDLLIVDELIKDIDFYSRRVILREAKNFQQQGGTIVCGFSNIEFYGHMSRIGWIDNGRLNIYEPEAAKEHWDHLVAEQRGGH
jgi:ABC-2 type transport system ATP-binding protein